MTPKEKAEELVVKYQLMAEIKYIEEPYVTTTSIKSKNAKIEFASKKCALIAVDEIIDAFDWHEYEVPNEQLKFWFEVIKEIEKL